MIALSGCDCIEGYARLSAGGECVSVDSISCKLKTILTIEPTTQPPKLPLTGKTLKMVNEYKKQIHMFELIVVCTRPFENYTVGISPCGNTCANYKKKCSIQPLLPISGCDCIPGYARLCEDDDCIAVDNIRCQLRMENPTQPTTAQPTCKCHV